MSRVIFYDVLNREALKRDDLANIQKQHRIDENSVLKPDDKRTLKIAILNACDCHINSFHTQSCVIFPGFVSLGWGTEVSKYA